MTDQRQRTSLELATESLGRRNDELELYLASSMLDRVMASPSVPLDDATARATKFWDEQEAKQRRRRSSVPPRAR